MGALWRFSGTIQRDDDDARLGGALAYFFDPNTTTPRATYTTAALVTQHAHPIEADANGRWPNVFLQYGTYRERICEPWLVEDVTAGAVITDADSIPNPEPPEAATGVADESLFITGRGFWSPFDEAVDGFVRCNGRTIGSATSGALERANVDCEDLFLKLYAGLSNTVCPVSGGRGASGALDWAANKTIGMPNMQGTVPGGLDTMGAAAGSTFDAAVSFIYGNATTAGSKAGLNHHLLTTAQAPAHTHALTAITSSAGGDHSHTGATGTESQSHAHTGTTDAGGVAHTHDIGGTQLTQVFGGGGTVYTALTTGSGNNSGSASATSHTHGFTSGNASQTHTHSISASGTHTHTTTGTSDSTGGGGNHNNTQRTMLGTFYMKL